jgi:hypothetical protein
MSHTLPPLASPADLASDSLGGSIGAATAAPSSSGSSNTSSNRKSSNGLLAYARFYSPVKQCYFWKRPGDLVVVREGERNGAWEEYFEVYIELPTRLGKHIATI